MPEEFDRSWLYEEYTRYRDRYIVAVDPASDVSDGAVVIFDTETGQMVRRLQSTQEQLRDLRAAVLILDEEGNDIFPAGDIRVDSIITSSPGTVIGLSIYGRAGTDKEGNDIFAPPTSKLEGGEYIWFVSDTYIEITTTPPKDGETRGEYMDYRYIGKPPRWWLIAVDHEALTERYVSKYDGYYTTTTIHEIIQASEIGWAEVRASEAAFAPVEDAEGYIYLDEEGSSLADGRFGMYYGPSEYYRYDNERFGASHP